jgi:hypothetical protein
LFGVERDRCVDIIDDVSNLNRGQVLSSCDPSVRPGSTAADAGEAVRRSQCPTVLADYTFTSKRLDWTDFCHPTTSQ